MTDEVKYIYPPRYTSRDHESRDWLTTASLAAKSGVIFECWTRGTNVDVKVQNNFEKYIEL